MSLLLFHFFDMRFIRDYNPATYAQLVLTIKLLSDALSVPYTMYY